MFIDQQFRNQSEFLEWYQLVLPSEPLPTFSAPAKTAWRLSLDGMQCMEKNFEVFRIGWTPPLIGSKLLAFNRTIGSPWFMNAKEFACFNVRVNMEWQLMGGALENWLEFRKPT